MPEYLRWIGLLGNGPREREPRNQQPHHQKPGQRGPLRPMHMRKPGQPRQRVEQDRGTHDAAPAAQPVGDDTDRHRAEGNPSNIRLECWAA